MSPVDILLQLKSRKIFMIADGDRLVLKNALGQLPEHLLIAIREQKAELLELCRSNQQPVVKDTVPDKGHYPLSVMQRNIWVDQMLHPKVANYNIGAGWRIEGTVKTEKLKEALLSVIQKHEILRTGFMIKSGEPRQFVVSQFSLPWKVLEPDVQQAEEIPETLYQLSFTLNEPPLFRFFYMKTGESEHYLYLVIHHLISDGWSLRLFFDQALQYYMSPHHQASDGREYSTVQFKSYALKQEGEISKKLHCKSETFWLEKLSQQSFILTGDKGTSQQVTFSGQNQQFDIDFLLHDQISSICQKEACTRFVFFLTVVKLTLFHFTGQSDIVIETPVLDRSNGADSDQMGPYLDSLPVCTNISSEASFHSLLRQVSSEFRQALAHKDFPVFLAKNKLKKKDSSMNALTNVNFTFHNKGLLKEKSLELGDIKVTKLNYIPKTVTNALSIYLYEYESSLTLSIDYSYELFSKAFIDSFCQKFRKTLHAILEDETATISQLLRTEEPEQPLDLSFNFDR